MRVGFNRRGFNALRLARSLAAAIAVLAAGAAGCRAGEAGAEPADAALPPAAPEIAIELSPEIGLGALLVTVKVAGPPAAAVRELRVVKAWADTRGAEVVRDIEVRDAQGRIDLGQARDEGPDRVYPLARGPAGAEVTVRYRASGAGAATSNLALRVGEGRISGVGYSFLLLPPIEPRIPAVIRFHPGALGRGAVGASSFGVGNEVRTEATSEELANAAYVAGELATAEGKSGERMVLLGKAELDIGAVFEWTLRVKESAGRVFGEGAPAPGAAGSSADPFVFLMVAQPGMGRSHDGAHLTRSLSLWFDADRALDPDLRIAIAHEVLHRWIGAAVRLDEGGGSDAVWFAEGFTVHYARRLLFDERLITASDFAEDLRRTLEPAPWLEGRGPAGARSDAKRRGALYAAHLDAALRARSRGERSLDDLMRDLLAAARRAPSEPLPITALRDRVVRDLGPEGGDEFDRMVVRAEQPIELSPRAFGPCFRRASVKEPSVELGFNPASAQGSPSVVRGVVKGSAAARAGLRDGALLLAAKLPDLDARADNIGYVELTVAGGKGGKQIRYKPVGTRTVVRWSSKACKR